MFLHLYRPDSVEGLFESEKRGAQVRDRKTVSVTPPPRSVLVLVEHLTYFWGMNKYQLPSSDFPFFFKLILITTFQKRAAIQTCLILHIFPNKRLLSTKIHLLVEISSKCCFLLFTKILNGEYEIQFLERLKQNWIAARCLHFSRSIRDGSTEKL